MKSAPRVIQREFALLPTDYIVTPPERVLPATSCQLWRHRLIRGAPIAYVNGYYQAVRRLVAGAKPGQRVYDICGLKHCVNKAHLRVVGKALPTLDETLAA